MSVMSSIDMECREYHNYSALHGLNADVTSVKPEQALLCPEKPVDKMKPFRNKQGKIRSCHYQENQTVCDWIEYILASPNFSGGYKLIRTGKGANQEYGFTTLAFLPQQRTEEVKKQRDYWIKSIYFNPKKLYYITKNSYKGHRAGEKNLFSLDNIVIDIDNHDAGAKEIDFYVNKLLYILEYDYQWKLPHYSVVCTGRGVQLWIGLESVYASEKLIYRYKQLSTVLCDTIQNIIDENKIRLTVDRNASIRADGLVKLPETCNPKRKSREKAKDKKVRYNRFPLVKYSLPELFREYTNIILPFDEDSEFRPVEKAAAVVPEKKYEEKPKKIIQKYNGVVNFSAYQLKKVTFLEELVKFNNGEMTGRREIVLFHYYNAACQIFEKSIAVKMVNDLNQQFTEPLHQNAVNSTIRGIDNHVVIKEDKKTKKEICIEKGAYTRYNTVTFLKDVCISEEEKQLYQGCTQSRERIRAEKRKEKQTCHEQIAELYSHGMTQQEIADTLHVAVSTVSRNLAKAKTSRPLKQENKQRNQEILKLKKKGLTQKQIAESLHISVPTVRKVLQKYTSGQTEKRNEQILKLHKEGKSQRAIAQQLGISRYLISSVLKEYQQESQNEEIQEMQTVADTSQKETVQETIQAETTEKHFVRTITILPFYQLQIKNIIPYRRQYLQPLCKLPAMRFKRGSPETKAGFL